MIPKNIAKEHIITAIEHVDKHGVDPSSLPRYYELIYNDKSYPPKYIIALANKFANGKLLNSDEFGGGRETNRFLENLGFKIKVSTLKIGRVILDLIDLLFKVLN